MTSVRLRRIIEVMRHISLTTLGAGLVAAVLAAGGGCGDSFDTANGSGATTASSSAGAGGAGGENASTTTSAEATTTAASGATGAGGATCQALGDECAACTFEACNAAYCTCYAEQDCAAIVSCFQACPPADQACQQTCMTSYPEAISPSFLLGGCAALGCEAQCPGTEPLDPCSKCLFTSCASQMNTCLSDPECTAVIQCAQDCPPGDSACITACGAAHPTAQGTALSVQLCGGSNCPGECGG